MPQPPTLKINEIFSSFQGEGLRQGEPTIFVRLSGCNLRCSFCDTRRAWDEGQEMSRAQIKDQIIKIHQDFPADWLCFTGGEPLLQNIQPLLGELKSSGFMTQVETNGTHPPVKSVDWYTISPKPTSYFFHSDFLRSAKEVKLVISKELNIRILKRLREKFPDQIPLLLQPEANRRVAMNKGTTLMRQALEMGLNNLRLSYQLHKLYDWR